MWDLGCIGPFADRGMQRSVHGPGDEGIHERSVARTDGSSVGLPSLGMWAMVAAAVIVALVLFVIVLKADRSLANGALAIITLLALGVAAATLMRDKPTAASAVSGGAAGQGALACLDGLAGERVETVCEKALFATADSTAAAVSYTAAQISRLPAVAAQGGPELGQLRRVLERDRYGLVAQVLVVRDGCTPQALRALPPPRQHVADFRQHDRPRV